MLAKNAETKEELTKGMKNQASQLRNSAKMYAMIGFTMFFIPVMGISAAVCAISIAVPCSIALGAGATIALIASSGVGLAVYSLSQDRNKGEGINNALAGTNLKVDNAEKRDSKEVTP